MQTTTTASTTTTTTTTSTTTTTTTTTTATTCANLTWTRPEQCVKTQETTVDDRIRGGGVGGGGERGFNTPTFDTYAQNFLALHALINFLT